MNYVRKTYINLSFSTACYGSEVYGTKVVKTRDISKIRIPKRVYGFYFYDIISLIVDVDGKKIELISEKINISPFYYLGGKVYTAAQIKREFPKEETLFQNACGSKDKMIKSRDGHWYFFSKNDVIIKDA